MDLFRASETLLRSASHPMRSLLGSSTRRSNIPSIRRPTTAPFLATRTPPSITHFSSTASARSPEDDPFSSPSNATQPPSSGTQTDPATLRSGVPPALGRQLNSTLDQTKGSPLAPSTRTSHFASPSAQASARTPSTNGVGAPTTSIDDLLKAMSHHRKPNQSSSGLGGSGVRSKLNPTGAGSLFGAAALEEASRPLTLGPAVGRTVHIDADRNVDVARAFKHLDFILRANSVYRDTVRQRRHERPGLARKRLKSERWRRQFKVQFRRAVGLVQKMRKQGW